MDGRDLQGMKGRFEGYGKIHERPADAPRFRCKSGPKNLRHRIGFGPEQAAFFFSAPDVPGQKEDPANFFFARQFRFHQKDQGVKWR